MAQIELYSHEMTLFTNEQFHYYVQSAGHTKKKNAVCPPYGAILHLLI